MKCTDKCIAFWITPKPPTTSVCGEVISTKLFPDVKGVGDRYTKVGWFFNWDIRLSGVMCHIIALCFACLPVLPVSVSVSFLPSRTYSREVSEKSCRLLLTPNFYPTRHTWKKIKAIMKTSNCRYSPMDLHTQCLLALSRNPPLPFRQKRTFPGTSLQRAPFHSENSLICIFHLRISAMGGRQTTSLSGLVKNVGGYSWLHLVRCPPGS